MVAVTRAVALARQQTQAETTADAAVHVLGLAAGIGGVVVLGGLVAVRRDWTEIAPLAAYSVGLLAMLGLSAAYNLSRDGRGRRILHRLDLAAIFAMIAGTYTPFIALGLDGGWALGMIVLVWTIAALGIAMKLIVPPDRFTGVSVGLYIAFGWVGLIAAVPIAESLSPLVLVLIVVGGLLYTVGTLFHLWERLPFQTAIWHGFVLSAAAVHFAAIVGALDGASGHI